MADGRGLGETAGLVVEALGDGVTGLLVEADGLGVTPCRLGDVLGLGVVVVWDGDGFTGTTGRLVGDGRGEALADGVADGVTLAEGRPAAVTVLDGVAVGLGVGVGLAVSPGVPLSPDAPSSPESVDPSPLDPTGDVVSGSCPAATTEELPSDPVAPSATTWVSDERAGWGCLTTGSGPTVGRGCKSSVGSARIRSTSDAESTRTGESATASRTATTAVSPTEAAPRATAAHAATGIHDRGITSSLHYEGD